MRSHGFATIDELCNEILEMNAPFFQTSTTHQGRLAEAEYVQCSKRCSEEVHTCDCTMTLSIRFAQMSMSGEKETHNENPHLTEFRTSRSRADSEGDTWVDVLSGMSLSEVSVVRPCTDGISRGCNDDTCQIAGQWPAGRLVDCLFDGLVRLERF